MIRVLKDSRMKARQYKHQGKNKDGKLRDNGTGI